MIDGLIIETRGLKKIYRQGDVAPGALAGRALRGANACLPLLDAPPTRLRHDAGLIDLPASAFLYAVSTRLPAVSSMRLARLKRGMTEAARSGAIFHLWWHPHNFGRQPDRNLNMLDTLLRHYRSLADRYGMQSRCMGDFA